MASTRARAPGGIAVTAALALVVGCAQIESSSVVEVLPRPDARPLVLGPPSGEITARGVAVDWSQDADRLALKLRESRTCASVRHVPVVRVERVTRKTAGGAMWWEYGLGAATLSLGLAGLIKPEAFSQAAIDNNGQIVKDKSTGYRIGGIFTGIGVLLLTGAVIDTVRTRDQVLYTDAYRRERGGTVECRDPLVPLQGQTVELLIGEWSSVEPTDDAGAVRFLLPAVEDLSEDARAAIEAHAAWDLARADAEAKALAEAEAKALAEAEAAAKSKRRKRGRGSAVGPMPHEIPPAEADAPADDASAELGPRPEPFVVKGVLRIDKARALAIDFVVPYDLEAATDHEGHGAVDPTPGVNPPPRPREVDAAGE